MIRVTWFCTPISARGGTLATLARWARHIDYDRFAIRFVFHERRTAGVAEVFAGTPVALVPIDEPLRMIGRHGVGPLRSHLLPADLVTTVFIQADILGAFALWSNEVPILSFAMGRLVPTRAAVAKRLIYRTAYGIARRRIARFGAVSAATGRELTKDFGVPAERVETVLSGVSLRHDRPPRQLGPGPTIGFVGALIEEKQPERFIQAASQLAETHPRARFVVLGDGPLRASCEALARRLALDGRIDFHGWVPNPADFYEQMDVLIFTSQPNYDGLPNVVLEALSAGTPVVATNVAGVPEVMRDRVEGRLVRDADPTALASAAAEIVSDDRTWSAYSSAALRRIADFTPEREVSQLMRLWEEVAASRERGSRRGRD